MRNTQSVAEYVYNELGQRIIKKLYNSSYAEISRTYYVGDVIYTQPVTGGTPGTATVQEYEVDGGGSGRLGIYYRPSNIYAYQLTDHLGNTRAVVARSGTNLQIRVYNDYYPYGMVIPPVTTGTNDYRYGYQGQYAEKDPETDWNAFELRMYDSKIARWLTIDPEGEFWSPYVAMGNNPIIKIDATGGCTECPDSRGWDRSKPWIDPNGSVWEATDNGWVGLLNEIKVQPGKFNNLNFSQIGAEIDAYRNYGLSDNEIIKRLDGYV